jgi:spermidine synthase/MFS family permease
MKGNLPMFHMDIRNAVWQDLLLVVIGVVFGIASQLDTLIYPGHDYSLITIILILMLFSCITTFFVFLLRKIVRDYVGKLPFSLSVAEQFKRFDTYAYTVLFYPLLRCIGIQFNSLFVVYIVAFLFIATHIVIIWVVIGNASRKNVIASMPMVFCAFFISGGCALIYQIVWQRVLFAEFGCNIESITIIVSVFMFGLGIGSLLGGRLSKKYSSILPKLFMICETLTGLFGLTSIILIKKVGEASIHNSLMMTFFIIFGLLFIPTLLMGATLPILVTYLHRQYNDVGKSVSILYFINTLGAAFACYITADILFALFGKQTTVILAAIGNFIIVFLFYKHTQMRTDGDDAFSIQNSDETDSNGIGTDSRNNAVRLILVLSLSFVMGYVSLSQEILWFRAISYVSGGKPTVFAHVLGLFLLGIALGSLYGKRICQRGDNNIYTFIATALTLSSIVYFVSLPIVSRLLVFSGSLGMMSAYIFIGVVSFLMGGIFPVLCHKGIASNTHVGESLSWIYFANIVGSTFGPLFTGFVLLDVYSLQINILYLCVFILLTAVVVFLLTNVIWVYKGPIILGIMIVASVMVTVSDGVYTNLLERLHFKTDFRQERAYKHIIQNKSGIIAVEPGLQDTIYGGGIYDGKFSIDPALDANGITRAYMIAALHHKPENILMIGLSSGSWAKVITHYNVLKHLTAVEINPGYLELIGKYPDIKLLLKDPRVEIHIDDGRRWLNSNPHARFDMIVMNTTFYWREGATNLLSADFLRICKKHLNDGGVIYYNTTGSEDVVYTASHVFKHIVRVKSFVAASDAPFALSQLEVRNNLLKFQQNNYPDLSSDALLNTLVSYDISDKGDEIRNKKNLWFITDDNMATEFKR